MNVFAPSLPVEPPTWWERANLYYSTVQNGGNFSVRVYVFPASGKATSDSPGTLRLQLEASASGFRVLDGDAHERGRIDFELPKIRIRGAMRRDGCHIWKLSARSLVLKRHAVQFASGDSWLFHTPWFSWLRIAGVQNGQVRVFGHVGRTRLIWILRVDPDCDDLDLLSLLAMMHRNWWLPLG